MRSAANVKPAISEMLKASLPDRLQGEVGVEDVKEWVRETLEFYDEEKARFPDQNLLPWSNMIGDDGDWENAFFFIVVIQKDMIELFCGTGRWSEVREFGEGDADDIPVSDLHREWSSRFNIPCPPLWLGREAMKRWLGREW